MQKLKRSELGQVVSILSRKADEATEYVESLNPDHFRIIEDYESSREMYSARAAELCSLCERLAEAYYNDEIIEID